MTLSLVLIGVNGLKVLQYDEILDIYFFYIFLHNRSFLDNLPNFNLLQTSELAVFGPFEKVASFSLILNQHLEQGKLMVAVNYSWK